MDKARGGAQVYFKNTSTGFSHWKHLRHKTCVYISAPPFRYAFPYYEIFRHATRILFGYLCEFRSGCGGPWALDASIRRGHHEQCQYSFTHLGERHYG